MKSYGDGHVGFGTLRGELAHGYIRDGERCVWSRRASANGEEERIVRGSTEEDDVRATCAFTDSALASVASVLDRDVEYSFPPLTCSARSI